MMVNEELQEHADKFCHKRESCDGCDFEASDGYCALYLGVTVLAHYEKEGVK